MCMTNMSIVVLIKEKVDNKIIFQVTSSHTKITETTPLSTLIALTYDKVVFYIESYQS